VLQYVINRITYCNTASTTATKRATENGVCSQQLTMAKSDVYDCFADIER